MKRILLAALAILFVGSALPQEDIPTLGYLGVGLEFDAQGVLVGANPLGFAPKEALCEKNAETTISATYAQHLVTKGHQLSVACLPVRTAPKDAPHGAIGMQLSPGTSQGFLGIAVEYDAQGDLFGARVLGLAKDADACMQEGKDTLESTYEAGKVKSGNTLVISCLAVPEPPQTL